MATQATTCWNNLSLTVKYANRNKNSCSLVLMSAGAEHDISRKVHDVNMGVRRNFSRGGKVDILLFLFRLLTMQRK